MKTLKLTSTFDFLGIGLSFLCLVHCLILPFVISFLPAFVQGFSGNENVHLFLSFMILPVSLFAVIPGYLKYRKRKVLGIMATGLTLIIGAVFFGHDLFGEMGEKAMSLLGGVLLVTGHMMNLSFCHSCPKCEKSESPKDFLSSHF